MSSPTLQMIPFGILLGACASNCFQLIRAPKELSKGIMLLVFNVCVTLCFLVESLKTLGLLHYAPHLYKLGTPFNFCFGPAIYLHFFGQHSKSNRTDPVWTKPWIHFLPFLLVFIALLPIYLQPMQQKLAWIAGEKLWLHQISPAIALMQCLHIGCYLGVTLLKKFKLSSMQKPQRPTLAFHSFQALYIALGLLCLMTLIVGFLRTSIDLDFPFVRFFISVLLIYFSFNYILSNDMPKQNRPRYDSSKLKNTKIETAKDLLEQLFTQDKLFKDSNLTPQKLARHLGLTSHELSQFLNVHLGKSFHEYLSTWRVQEVASQLKCTQLNQSILDMAYDAGFNSKSTFYNAFKREFQKTPLAYHKSYLSALGSKSDPKDVTL